MFSAHSPILFFPPVMLGLRSPADAVYGSEAERFIRPLNHQHIDRQHHNPVTAASPHPAGAAPEHGSVPCLDVICGLPNGREKN